MNVVKNKKMIAFLVLCFLLITSVTGCSTLQNLGKDNGEAANILLTSDYAVVELGNIWLFDEENSTVGISYILRPGSSTEYNKYYDMKIIWGEYVVGGGMVTFRSQDSEDGGMTITLEAAAEQFIKLLTETSEYQKLLREFESLQEEKRK